MNAFSPIGVFDSGVGGLTVLNQLRRLLPGEDFVYFGDTARAPYGPRPEAEIRKFVDEILAFLAGEGIKLAVVACNTITVLGIDSLRKNHKFLMVGMSKGARLAANATRNGRVGVIATEGTIRSGAHVAEIKAFAPHLEVFPQACPMFAPAVEAENFAGPDLEQAAREYLAPLKAAGVDTVVLACTHYPLLTDLIAKIMGPEVTLLDPAAETAQQAKELLHHHNLLNPSAKGSTRLYFSADAARAERIASRLFDTSDCVFATRSL